METHALPRLGLPSRSPSRLIPSPSSRLFSSPVSASSLSLLAMGMKRERRKKNSVVCIDACVRLCKGFAGWSWVLG
ncbi:hypothetical protein E2C01_023699 [Portunus trituberculatus]|uniref:Uncharacterized protein n=1 Tax=Portunus trituberculatus TaxID=210409 RepID=A0A5B7EBU5_PORTR|nr:hypothetical protein [Portunus trituberculatus]